jgi:HJR/Mrr/RecB family endonuclease
LQQSDIEFSNTKREVAKDYTDGMTDPARLIVKKEGGAVIRKVLREQERIEKQIITEVKLM